MTCVETIMSQIPQVYKPQRNFMLCLFTALQAFSRRATMANLSRYGAGSERSIARWARRDFDFTAFNLSMLKAEGVLEHRTAAAFDPSFIRKSGKHTWGLSCFYNGCASRPEKGLEACTVALLDRDERTAYAVAVEQTPASLPEKKNRNDFYLEVFAGCAEQLREHTQHLVVDGGLVGKKFVKGVTDMDFHLVGKLRCDADLRLLYDGPYAGHGRPKRYAGKVDFQSLSGLTAIDFEDPDTQLFSAIVNHKTLKRDVRVAILVNTKGPKRRHVVLFSTDTSLVAEQIVEMYRLRFQIEFLFRDGKQFTGFGHAEVRDEKGLWFFLNASMSALNLTRLEDRSVHQETEGRVVSIAS